MSKEPAAPAAEPADDAPKKSSPLPLILALVAGLAVGGGAGMFVVGPALAAGIAPETVAAGAKAHGEGEEADSAEAEEGDGHESKKEGEEGASAPVYVIDNLVLNPSASGGTRFLLLTVAFEMKTSALSDDMKARDAELRDHVLNIIGAKTVEQLAEMSTREALKVELAADVGKLLKKKQAVKRIYFPQFVIQ